MFNVLEVSPGIWAASDPKFDNPTYGGVRLKSSVTREFKSFEIMFPRIQAFLRRYAVQKLASSEDLFQWYQGSKVTNGSMESLVTLNADWDYVEIQVRGPKESAKDCFFFLEEILATVDQVLVEMSPGQVIEKHILSSSDLLTHADVPHCWEPVQVMTELMKNGFKDGKLTKSSKENPDPIVNIICFGSIEVLIFSNFALILTRQSPFFKDCRFPCIWYRPAHI